MVNIKIMFPGPKQFNCEMKNKNSSQISTLGSSQKAVSEG